MANADGYVLPKPGVPKTLGILNIIFGVLLVLYGLCQVGGLLAAPALVQFAEKTVKDVQAQQEAQQKKQLKDLDDRAAAAKTDEEKQAIEKEKANVLAAPPPPQPVDMSAMTGQLRDPTVMAYSYLQFGTGVLMNILLIVAGIGLIRLTSWGRSLSLWLAGLQIVRLAIIAAVGLVVIQPITAVNTEKMLAKMEADAKVQGGAPGAAASVQAARTMAGMSSLFIVAYLVFGSIYPVVTLILLNSAGARAACQGRKPEGPPDF
jgi:hypothetical protein